eukprot:3438926-Prymnesium_polylepis.2
MQSGLALCRGAVTLPSAWSLTSRCWPLDGAAAFAAGVSAMETHCEAAMSPICLAALDLLASVVSM